jgi:glycosyltransferase involved in cell wall biosynthesis
MPANSVTVLIPTFNRAHLLVESLDSVLAQTRRPDQIIVINDGSTDDTLERLEPYRGDIEILNKDNAGKSAALNKALSVAKGDLIWVFDDDDIAEPDALEILLGLLDENPDADFAYGRHDRFEVRPDGRVKWKDTGYWRKSPPEDFLFETLLDMFAHQPGMLVRKSLYIKAGAFDESLSGPRTMTCCFGWRAMAARPRQSAYCSTSASMIFRAAPPRKWSKPQNEMPSGSDMTARYSRPAISPCRLANTCRPIAR